MTRRAWIMPLVSSAVAVGIIAVAVMLVLRLNRPAEDAPSAAATATGAPSNSATRDASPTAAPSEAPTATPTPPNPTAAPTAPPLSQPVIPKTCAELYANNDWSAVLAPSVLNPVWTIGDSPIWYGDHDLGWLMREKPPLLTCSWAIPQYGDAASRADALVTRVVQADAAKLELAQAVFRQKGYDCWEVWGGTRCIIVLSDGDLLYGGSHFIRDGLWLGTMWQGNGPYGYTESLVKKIWPNG